MTFINQENDAPFTDWNAHLSCFQCCAEDTCSASSSEGRSMSVRPQPVTSDPAPSFPDPGPQPALRCMDYFPICQKTSGAHLPQLAIPPLLSTTIFKSFVFTHVTAILKSYILTHAVVLLSSSSGCTTPSPSPSAFTALFPHRNTLLPPSGSRSHR